MNRRAVRVLSRGFQLASLGAGPGAARRGGAAAGALRAVSSALSFPAPAVVGGRCGASYVKGSGAGAAASLADMEMTTIRDGALKDT